MTRRSLILGIAGTLMAGCASQDQTGGADAPIPTDTPIPADTPVPTVTPTTTPAPTRTPMPTSTPEQYVGKWTNITPPISLTFNDPKNNYGAQSLVIDPKHPATLYLGTCYQGLWKTTDGGRLWEKINIGRNAWALDIGRIWALAIDPVEPQVLYTTSGFGAGGVWKTTDGGVNWDSILPSTLQERYSRDVYSISVCPEQPSHLLISFHSPFHGQDTAGLMQSRDGGATWDILALDVPWLSLHVVFHLSPTTFLVTTAWRGFWRSADVGKTWTRVSMANLQDGGNQICVARNGTIYSGGLHTLLASSNDGVSWQPVSPVPIDKDGYYAVVAAEGYLFTAISNAGAPLGGPTSYYVSPEDDGRRWRRQSAQRFSNGPKNMAVDPASRSIYSSNWNAGVWKLTLSP